MSIKSILKSTVMALAIVTGGALFAQGTCINRAENAIIIPEPLIPNVPVELSLSLTPWPVLFKLATWRMATANST